MSTPQTTICICSGVRLDNSYKHSIWFDNLNDQSTYFYGKVVKTFEDYSYCRKNWSIKLHATIAKARSWSYLFFDNPEDLKTYYYFITDVQYINDETVEVFLEMDVIQTYLFEMRLLPSFVERETPRTDEIGENTLDEGLDLGQYTIRYMEDVEDLQDLLVMTMASVDLSMTDFPNTLEGDDFGQVYSGLKIFATDMTHNKIKVALDELSAKNKLDAIVSMWCYPKALVSINNTGGAGSILEPEFVFNEVMSSDSLEVNDLSLPKDLIGYTPRNKKLLSYPYIFLQASNNMGNTADFRFERFEDSNPKFVIYGSIFPDGAVKLIPCNYNGIDRNHEESLTLSGYPTCAWTGDTYKIWLAQNQNQRNVQGVTNALTMGGGAVMGLAGLATLNPLMIGSGVTMAGHGLTAIAGQIAQREDMKTYPPQSRGSQNASVNAVNGQLTFTFYVKCITEDQARIIDDYFTLYGYKCQQVKTPSIHNRELFTYTKTIGCTVAGEFCNEDKNKISSIFDNGVTFWTNGDLIGEYGETNGFLD